MSDMDAGQVEATSGKRPRSEPPFGRIDPKYWERAKQRHWTSDTTLMGCYLRSAQSARSEGLYYLTVERMLADLPKGWGKARIRAALAQLEQDSFAFYDEDAGVVFLPDALIIQKTKNPNGRITATRSLITLPETPLWRYFVEAAARYDGNLYDVLTQQFPERLGAAEWGWDIDEQPLTQQLRQPLTQPQALALSSSSNTQPLAQDSNLNTQNSELKAQGSGSNTGSVAQTPVEQAGTSPTLVSDEEREEPPTTVPSTYDDDSATPHDRDGWESPEGCELLKQAERILTGMYPGTAYWPLLSECQARLESDDTAGHTLIIRAPNAATHRRLDDHVMLNQVSRVAEPLLGSAVQVRMDGTSPEMAKAS